ncbi:MAG: hypothetical protein ACRDRK_21715, partial [Pseudonocardia sp.]
PKESRDRMAPPNLTRIDAERRAALLQVADYRVELDLTNGAGEPGDTTFASTTTVRFSCREPGAASWIDLIAAGVSAATLNGITYAKGASILKQLVAYVGSVTGTPASSPSPRSPSRFRHATPATTDPCRPHGQPSSASWLRAQTSAAQQ